MSHTIGMITGTTASVITVGFGVWHFFVPTAWKWWDHISPEATELVAAVRAINVFFSLSLVLFGTTALVFLHRQPASVFHTRSALGVLVVLWIARVGMQIAYPQGSLVPSLRWGMLATFVTTLVMYLVALVTVQPGQ